MAKSEVDELTDMWEQLLESEEEREWMMLEAEKNMREKVAHIYKYWKAEDAREED